MICPLCGRFSPDGSPRCTACGADVRDPDVLALAAAPSRPLTAPADEPLELGALSDTHLFGVGGAGIVDGSSLRRIAWVGAALLALGAALPIDRGDGGGLRLPIGVDGLSRFAQLLPFALAVLGLGLAIAGRRIPPVALGGVLLCAGLAELAWGLVPFGDLALTPTELPVATWLGLSIGAIGLWVRVIRPADPIAPWIIVAAAAIYIGGGLIPHDQLDPILPIELRNGEDGAFLSRAVDGVGEGFANLPGLFALLPAGLLPLGALLAFRHPDGIWDRAGLPLRAIGVAITLAIPGAYAVDAFNLLGFTLTDDHPHVVAMRMHLAVVAAGAALWLAAGGAGVLVSVRARSTRTG